MHSRCGRLRDLYTATFGMSHDEVFVTIVAAVAGPLFWGIRLVRWAEIRRSGPAVRVAIATLAACIAVLAGVLSTMAASDVVRSPAYVLMYLTVGLAWIRMAETGFAFAGVSLREDGAERRNRAALTAWAGGLMAVTLCYAGANVGEGPGWWVVVFSAALATAGLFACWLVLGRVTSVIDAVTIDRDPAAGLRLGAFLVACALVAGRAVAGDWASAAQTIRDAAHELPALALVVIVAVLAERRARPTAERPRAPFAALGVGPAVAYLAIAGGVLVDLGWPA